MNNRESVSIDTRHGDSERKLYSYMGTKDGVKERDRTHQKVIITSASHIASYE